MSDLLRNTMNLLKEPNAKKRAVDSIINKKFTRYSGVTNEQFNTALSRTGMRKRNLTRYQDLAIKKLLNEGDIRDITKDEISKVSERLKDDINVQSKMKIGIDWFKDPAKKLISSSSTQREKDYAAKQLGMRVGVTAVGALAAGKIMHDLDSKDTLLGKLPYSSKDAMHLAIDTIVKL